MDTRVLYGRKTITSDTVAITSENVVAELEKAMQTHTFNREEIEYLWNYYRGKQPILYRTKDVRPEICNKIGKNHNNTSFIKGRAKESSVNAPPQSFPVSMRTY